MKPFPPSIQAIWDLDLPLMMKRQMLRNEAQSLSMDLVYDLDIHSKEYGKLIDVVPVEKPGTTNGGTKRFG